MRTEMIWLAIFATIVSFICFIGNDHTNVQFIPGNLSKTKITANVSFEFESKVRTDKLREEKKLQAKNVYSIDEKRYDYFIKALKLLDERMESFSYKNAFSKSGRDAIREFASNFDASSSLKIEWQDIALLISSLEPIERTQIFQECVSILREISKDGVFYDENGQSNELHGFRIKGRQQPHIRTYEGALHYMRTYLSSLDLDKDVTAVLFRILKQGIKSNLIYDAEESKIDINLVLRAIKPVLVHYEVGDVILEKNVTINQELRETLIAYQKALKLSSSKGHWLHNSFFLKTFSVFLTVYVAFFTLKFFSISSRTSPRSRHLMLATLAILQLAMARLFLQIGELNFFIQNFTFIHILCSITPITCATTMGTLLSCTTDGLILSAIVSILYSLMLSQSIDFTLMVFASCFILVALLKDIKLNSKIFTCSTYSGLSFATFTLINSILNLSSFNKDTALYRVIAAMLMPLISSLISLFLLPLFERIFFTNTDISISKLTDYNNELLQKLQLLAPGTYQHSLMVSNLVECVADVVNANKIICKTAALFHDIGKISKPEYFIENQSNHVNLHDQQTPYISSLIVKNHVKEGVILAESNRVPKIIIDIIREHHGTTITQIFYDRARSDILSTINTTGMTKKEIDNYLCEKLDKSSFRYDGPRPRTKESAIVMLADSIEAASRGLKKITHQNIENMVESVLVNKINDHQFDKCDMTLNELGLLKKAFSSTLLNMLHSRINYKNFDLEGNDNRE